MGVNPKNNGFSPKIIHLFIGVVSIIFTIHFGGKTHYFWFNTHIISWNPKQPFINGCFGFQVVQACLTFFYDFSKSNFGTPQRQGVPKLSNVTTPKHDGWMSRDRKLGSMVGKLVISPTYKWGLYWGYNPLTNHLLTSRDIQVLHSKKIEKKNVEK